MAMITFIEFQQTLTACGYLLPTNIQEKYNGLINAIPAASITTRAELAMFLANIYHESGGLMHTEEINPAGNYEGGQRYRGRGYIQLTHQSNYRHASLDLYRDDRLVDNPDLVAQDENVAWATTAWFWRRNVHRVHNMTFEGTINAINPIDTPAQIHHRQQLHAAIQNVLYI